MSEIDPFTFFANFNRGTTDENRILSWNILKTEWNLESSVPEDFSGVPVVQNVKSWFFSYSKSRESGTVDLLWELAEQAINGGIEGIQAETFQQVLNLKGIGRSILTMALFWVRPDEFFSADNKNRSYVEKRGIGYSKALPPWEAYRDWVSRVKATAGNNFPELSHEAHLEAMEESKPNGDDSPPPDSGGLAAPFDRIFENRKEAEQVFSLYARILPSLGIHADGDHPTLSLTLPKGKRSLRLNYGNFLIAAFNRTPWKGFEPHHLALVFEMKRFLGRDPRDDEEAFDQKPNGEKFKLYSADLEGILAEDSDTWKKFAEGAALIGTHFQNWRGSSYRTRAHRLELLEMCFNEEIRNQYLSEGIPELEEEKMNEPEDFISSLGWSESASQFRLAKSVIAASISKPFIILTGGSGSGKTAIAKAMATYFRNAATQSTSIPFVIGESVGLGHAAYQIKNISRESLTIENPNGSLIVFPIALVQEWINAVKLGKIDESMAQGDQRNIVKENSKFDSYYHGWTAQLTGLGYKGANRPEAISTKKTASNSAIIPVGADWTDNRNVLGFVNHLRPDGQPVFQSTPVLDLILEAAKPENSAMPFFLILDEMNLSHVERYFADFLSVMEQKDGVLQLHSEGLRDDDSCVLPRYDGDESGVPRTIPYPQNLFVIGTVNIDETTYMFSPKVLDRANVIEFTVESDEIDSFLKTPGEYPEVEKAENGVAEGFLALALQARRGELDSLPDTAAEAVRKHIVDLHELLKKGRFEFAYRTANEVNRYLRVCRHLAEDKAEWDSGGWRGDLDDQIVQKILPKLHGSVGRVGRLLGSLAVYCGGKSKVDSLEWFPVEGKAPPLLQNALTAIGEGDQKHQPFPKSREKLSSMIEVLLDEQFVSFIN